MGCKCGLGLRAGKELGPECVVRLDIIMLGRELGSKRWLGIKIVVGRELGTEPGSQSGLGFGLIRLSTGSRPERGAGPGCLRVALGFGKPLGSECGFGLRIELADKHIMGLRFDRDLGVRCWLGPTSNLRAWLWKI